MRIEMLGENDKMQFEEAVQEILRYNHLNQYTQNRKGKKELNKNYKFVKDNFDVFKEYLNYAGFRLQIMNNQFDKNIIYLESDIEITKCTLKKLESACLFVLRYLYEENKMSLNNDGKAIVTMDELFTNLVGVFNIYNKEPEKSQIVPALKVLEEMYVIKLIKVQDEEYAIEVYPYICCVLTNEKIKIIADDLRNGGTNNDTE